MPGGAEAGRIQTRFEEPRGPRATTRITRGLESTIPPSEAAGIELRLDAVLIEGSTVYDAETLRAFYEAHIGRTVTLATVFDIAAKITAKYGNDGYLLSRAIVPPQELDSKGARIQLRVIEGYVDEVRWPEGMERYRDFFSRYGEQIKADRPLNVRTLERYLLLANDLPGLSFESNLVASESKPGASALVITRTEDPTELFATIDNHGVDASGPYQGTVGGALNNLLGLHERIEGGITTAGPSMNGKAELLYGSWKYSQVLTPEGLTFFHEGNVNKGDPGTAALLALGYTTRGFNLSAGLSYPIIRTRNENLTATFAVDFKESQSVNLGILATSDRLRIVRAELAYERADPWNGVNQITAGLSQGILGLGSTTNTNPLASRIPGVVNAFIVTGTLSRTQRLPGRLSLYGAVSGQWTATPLLSSQECGYGGRTFGRGFDASIITGDQCLLATVELRHDLRVPDALSGIFTYAQPYAFIDYGRIWNITPPLGTPAMDDGASIGAGLRFGGEHFSVDAAVSTTIRPPASQPTAGGTRGWFKATARF